MLRRWLALSIRGRAPGWRRDPRPSAGCSIVRYRTPWAEWAIRTDMAPGGKLDPAWRVLFLRDPDDLMPGTDTRVTSRGGELPGDLEAMRAWLGELPREVAGKTAHRNVERLFGS